MKWQMSKNTNETLKKQLRNNKDHTLSIKEHTLSIKEHFFKQFNTGDDKEQNYVFLNDFFFK